MPYEFYLGIDSHEADDQKQIATALIEKRQNDGEPEYALHSLKQYDGGDADQVIDAVLDEISDTPYAGRTVCVTNISENTGGELQKKFGERGFSTINVRMTGGDTSPEQGQPLSFGEDGVHVSEHEIVSTMEGVHRSGRLDTQAVKSDEPTALAQGLEDYHVAADESGEALQEKGPQPSRPGAHSTLVLAAGSAVWLAEQHSFDPTEHMAGDPPPVRRAKQEMRPDTT